MENKGETGSRGSNSRLPFGVNVYLNLPSNLICLNGICEWPPAPPQILGVYTAQLVHVQPPLVSSVPRVQTLNFSQSTPYQRPPFISVRDHFLA